MHGDSEVLVVGWGSAGSRVAADVVFGPRNCFQRFVIGDAEVAQACFR